MGIADVDLAAWLRRAREAAGLDEESICQKTKIHPKFIRALEAGQYDVLPSSTHVRSFAVAYAKVCEADEVEVLKLVAQATGREPVNAVPETAPSPEAAALAAPPRLGNLRRAPELEQDDQVEGRWSLWAGMALGVAVLLWALTQLTAPRQSGDAVEKVPVDSSSVVESKAPGKTEAKKVAAEKKSRPQLVPPSKKESTRVSSSDKTSGAAGMAVAAGATGQGDQNITLRSRRDCWLVVELDGKRLPVVILAAEEKKVFYFKDKLVLLAGNAGALKGWYNGDSVGWLGDLGQRVNGLVFERGKSMHRDPEQSLELPMGIQAIEAGAAG